MVKKNIAGKGVVALLYYKTPIWRVFISFQLKAYQSNIFFEIATFVFCNIEKGISKTTQIFWKIFLKIFQSYA